MNLLLVGLNHRTAPVQLREQLAIPLRELDAALDSLHATPDVREAVILSTCNRVELYVNFSSRNLLAREKVHSYPTFDALVDFLAFRSRLAPESLQRHLYRLADRETAEHLFRVTAGLDSMILGEPEITAQVKQAYLAAQTQGTAGPALNRLFQKALHCAKTIRARTRVAEGHASIGSVVVALAKQRFGDRLRQCDVLLWGAGKAAESTARHLIKTGVGQLWIVNRTPLKARDLATLCQSGWSHPLAGGRRPDRCAIPVGVADCSQGVGWLSWEQALGHLAHVDIAIVCTQAPHYVIDQADLDRLASQRGSRPLFIIDLAVPRNVDPAVQTWRDVQLYNIDDVQGIVQANMAIRERELARCESIIQEQVEQLMERERTDQGRRGGGGAGVMAQGGGS